MTISLEDIFNFLPNASISLLCLQYVSSCPSSRYLSDEAKLISIPRFISSIHMTLGLLSDKHGGTFFCLTIVRSVCQSNKLFS